MSENENELTYINSDGDTVFTSAFLKKRGTCCKTNCLHCPFDFTIKNYSIEVEEMKLKHLKFANEIIRDNKPVEQSDISKMLLASAFGKKDKLRTHHITEDNLSNFAFGIFKGHACAVIEFSNKLSESNKGKSNSIVAGRSVKNLFLKKEFQNQGLGIEHINLS
ncbi:DUF5522 domain-containing protein [Halobacteriovorax sp. GB3]|uniref:DUF5522 domain-containing protein n=1 Tax=Halobacteriovorax sp. GB3 TaxID=2719615 RepID=UPI00235EBE09|nr:DUF5522 domain-containing protein [Halobacteriovorax sp. GB3]MDD0851648.1 DUF5522 domain-containing protein [Halobacteriovorax sp. GB3]